MSESGTAMGQREKRSTTVNRYLYPFDSGKVTKSMLMWRNLLFGTLNSPIGGTVCLVIFDCWQGMHSLAQRVTSWRTEGHTTLAVIVCRVRSTPGWPKPWRTSKTFLLEANGMYGRAGPLLTSTIRFLLPMQVDMKFSPDLELSRSNLNSGSSGCCCAISFQSNPISAMELTTMLRSDAAASRLFLQASSRLFPEVVEFAI